MIEVFKVSNPDEKLHASAVQMTRFGPEASDKSKRKLLPWELRKDFKEGKIGTDGMRLKKSGGKGKGKDADPDDGTDGKPDDTGEGDSGDADTKAEKDLLMERAKELGVPVHANTGVEKLREIVQDAEANAGK